MADKKKPVKYLHLPLDPQVHTDLKVLCAEVKVPMQDYAMQAIEERLQREKKRSR